MTIPTVGAQPTTPLVCSRPVALLTDGRAQGGSVAENSQNFVREVTYCQYPIADVDSTDGVRNHWVRSLISKDDLQLFTQPAKCDDKQASSQLEFVRTIFDTLIQIPQHVFGLFYRLNQEINYDN